MKRYRRKLLLLLLVPGVLAIILWWSFRQPSYQGRPLSEWLDDLGAPTNNPKAAVAVQAIGDRALPFLLSDLNRQIHPPKNHVSHWIQHVMVRLNLRDNRAEGFNVSPGVDNDSRANRSVRGFAVLGPTASNAIPQLAVWLEQDSDFYAANALAGIGELAIPALTNVLIKGDRVGRVGALHALRQMDKRGRSPVPAILSCLQDTNAIVRIKAVETLGYLGHRAELVVPLLTNLIYDADTMVSQYAVAAVGEFGAEAESAIPALLPLLADTNPIFRSTVYHSYSTITNSLRGKVKKNIAP